MSNLDVAEINIIMSKSGNNFNTGYGPGGHGHNLTSTLLLNISKNYCTIMDILAACVSVNTIAL